MRMARGNLPRLLTFIVLWEIGGAFKLTRKSVRHRQEWSSPVVVSLEHANDGDGSFEHALQGPSHLQNSFDSISSHFQDLSADEVQKALVRTGFDFAERDISDDSSSRPRRLQSPFEKVPGCVANVRVRTILQPDTLSSGEGPDYVPSTSYRVHLEGTADALLSRGLLAVLAKALQNVSADQILELPSDQVADRLSIRPALSQGRNDGLASMVRTIQKQVQTLITSVDNEDEAVMASLSSFAEARDDISDPQPQHTRETDNGVVIRQQTVALLLSGGVDSSVALNLLKRQGYNVTAYYLKIWLEDELAHLGKCPWEDDFRVCQQVCEQAGVPLDTISLQHAYKEWVISYTVREAEHGRTPNPDIMCNSRIKFGCFYEAIATRDFDFVATGHYAQLVNDTDAGRGMRLFRAPDHVKDQSYFLCALTQEQLQRVMFPIGHLQKPEVRALADEFELPNRNRPDSQGLCFLGKVKFEEFLAAYLGERPGQIVDAATGDILGQHRGVWYHTVGQRKGIGKVLDPVATSRGPWYVVAKDPESDVVFVSNEYEEDRFTAARSSFAVENIQWTAGTPPAAVKNDSSRLIMKIRHGPRLVEGTLTLTDADGFEGDVQLDAKDSGLAPGQFVVFYDDEECLGGGVISERHWATFLLNRSLEHNAAG